MCGYRGCVSVIGPWRECVSMYMGSRTGGNVDPVGEERERNTQEIKIDGGVGEVTTALTTAADTVLDIAPAMHAHNPTAVPLSQRPARYVQLCEPLCVVSLPRCLASPCLPPRRVSAAAAARCPLPLPAAACRRGGVRAFLGARDRVSLRTVWTAAAGGSIPFVLCSCTIVLLCCCAVI